MSVKDTKGAWVLIFPIENLTLTPAVKNEIRVDRVTFIRHSKLKRKCKTLGLPNYSQLTEGSTVESFFEERDENYTYAIVRESGLVDAAGEQAEELISIELDVLALSKLYAGRFARC